MNIEKAIDQILIGIEFTIDDLVKWMGVSVEEDLSWAIDQFEDGLIINHSLRLDVQGDGATFRIVRADETDKQMAVIRAVNASVEQ